VVTYFLEVLGVATGMVFGDYVYGYALGLRLLEVPVLIGFNWVLVILGFLRASQHLFIRGKADTRRGRGLLLVTASVLIPAAGAVVFDYIMEPVAIELEYWIWAAGKVPLQNYLAWFLIALAASLAFRLTRITFSSMLPFYYAVIQMLFFIGLYWV
jgi:putative membrane protein